MGSASRWVTASRAHTMLVAALVVAIRPGSAPAQSPARLAGTYTESIHSEIVTQTGASERHRSVVRTAQFGVASRSDTSVVTADTIHLTESVDGVRHTVDVDAVIGARWKLLLHLRARVTVIERPVVPVHIADVSDIGTAMDDFFPAAPPRLAIGAGATDSAGRKWRRLTDSVGIERYHYAGVRRETTHTSSDSVPVESAEAGAEDTELAWSATRGPLAWTRHIQTGVTTRFAGRTVRAQVDQRIAVRRTA